MAFDWEHVEAIRAEQNSARNRRDLNTLPTDETSERIYNSPTGIDAKVPKLDHWEQLIQKVRTQLIDYIISHGLVQGFEYDGIDEPIKNGKIVLTADMLKRVTDRFGYFREKETREFIETYLPEHFYVADENYVHTDNNYTEEEKEKLSGIADGAEVNKVISILFNGVETINPETRVATITITPADVKTWYEQNPDTNVFTDAEKAKLESIDIDALSNKVEDVTLDGETVVKNKIAVLTAKKIKDSYENNPDTNAFTDADKVLVEQVTPEVQKVVNQHEKRLDDLEKSQTTQDAEIADAKNSISELGDEVNSVAGRVTNLESSQKIQDGKIDALEKWKNTTDATVNSLEEKNTEQDGRLDVLETSDATQDADILQLKEDVKNAGKVDDVQVDGVSVVENKVAKIPKVYTEDEIQTIVNALVTEGYVPYKNGKYGLWLDKFFLAAAPAPSSKAMNGAILSTFISSSGYVSQSTSVSENLNTPGLIIRSGYNVFYVTPFRIKMQELVSNSIFWLGFKYDNGKDHFVAASDSGLTKPIIMKGDTPIDDNDLTTKKYVDDTANAAKIYTVDVDFAYDTAINAGSVDRKTVSLVPNHITVPTGKKVRLLGLMIKENSTEFLDYHYGLGAEADTAVFIMTKNNTDRSVTPVTKTMTVTYDFIDET